MEEILLTLKSLEMNCHFWHLATKGIGSHAAHKQFQALYEGLNESFDSLAEAYSGVLNKKQKGSRLEFPVDSTLSLIPLSKYHETLVFVSDLLGKAELQFKDMLHIQNILCTIHELIDSSIFLLTFE